MPTGIDTDPRPCHTPNIFTKACYWACYCYSQTTTHFQLGGSKVMFSVVIAAHSTWLGGYGELLNTCKRTISSLTCVYIHVYAHPQDLCSKLVVLTWEDWSPEVRQAAAQALGLSGHGKASRRYSHAMKMQKCNSEIPGTLCILHCCCSSSTMKSRGGLRVGLKLSALML